MQATLPVTIAANAIIALAYYAISSLIFAGLYRQRSLGFNALGTATAFIFFTCALGHSVHVEHYLRSPHLFDQEDLWHQMLADSVTVIPAIAYLAQRRRYGLVISGQHALLDFQRRLAVAEALREIGQDIAARTELDDVLSRVLHHACLLLGADYGAVATSDESGEVRLHTVGSRTDGWDNAAWRQAVFAPGTSEMAGVVAGGRPLVVHELSAEPSFSRGEHPVHRAEGGRSILAVPLFRGEQVIGSLMVAYRSVRQLSSEEVTSASALASQAVVAIENARLIASIRRAERLKDEFLSVAAHELKTPVTSLRGFTQVMIRQLTKEGSLDPQRIGRALHTVDRQSEKLARLVQQLLDVSRLEAGRLTISKEVVDVVAIVNDAVESARGKTSLHSIVVSAPDSLRAAVDPLRIEQVVTNLLDNAVKYSPEGGLILVEVCGPDSGMVQLAVTDRGIGIPPEHLGRIFDRFYQAPSGDSSAGLGLGLYISRQIVELHGGQITVESSPEEGTRFTVTLPVGLGIDSTHSEVAPG